MKTWKRMLAVALALVLCIGQIPALTAPAYAATCPGSGNHTKSNCDYTVIKVTTPDCSNAGYTTYQCNVCQENFVDDIVPGTGEHQWEELPGKAPTCTEPGYEPGKKCSVCGLMKSGAMIPALSETATECEWVDMTPYINCETGGTKVYQCSVCGATEEMKVEASQHTWDDANPKLVQPATSTESGLAHVTCTTCLMVKEVEVLFTHEHDKKNPAGYIVTYLEVAATCTTTGMKAYMQCRVCGAVNFQRSFGTNKVWGWYELTEAEWASLVIPATHTFEQVPTCVDSCLPCVVCKQMVDIHIDHAFEKWNVMVAPTCAMSGYQMSTCSICGVATSTDVLPALGHIEVEVNVPATCVSNAYSYTYCTRIGCVDCEIDPTEGVHPMVADALVPTQALAVGQPYYFALTQQLAGSDLFFNGRMDGKFLGVTNNVFDAVPVMLEIVHPMAENTYRMYFYDHEGVKTYIEIYEYDTNNHKVGVHLTTAPVNTFNWNADLGILTSTFKVNKADKTYYLGTYNSYLTMSASEIRYITGSQASKVGVTQFPAYLCEVGVEAPVNVIKYSVEKNSINVNAHTMTSSVIVVPTCTEPGMKQVRCALCGGAADIVEIPAGHCWIPMTGELTIEGKKVNASRAADCEDGWQYYQCSLCQEIKQVTTAGYGHVFGDVVQAIPDHINTVAYDYQSCIYCGYTENLNLRIWEDLNRQWDTFETANKAHAGALTGGKLVKAGDCKNYGLNMYTCTECNKAVYVKIAGTGDHVMPEGTAFMNPTCTSEGYLATYQCVRCKEIVGNAKLGALNEIPALGHVWEANKNYKAASCDAPNYANIKYICTVCGESQYDGTELVYFVPFDSFDPCTCTSFEYYRCHCGEEHIISFITALGHEMVELPRDDTTYRAPTCSETGYTTYICVACGMTQQIVLDINDAHRFEDDLCVYCGLALELSADGSYYIVVGAGECRNPKIIIPASHNKLPVAAVGDSAFENQTGITQIVIPNSVTTIGTRAFYGCSGIEEITIPASVSNIGTQIFYKCTSLHTVYYNGSYGSNENSFLNVSSIKKVVFGGTKVPDYACKNATHLEEIVILDGVTSIGHYAFQNCNNVSSIQIPDSIMEISSYAFYQCNSLTSIRIPDGITRINESTFLGCKGLTSIYIPNSVTSIEMAVFNGCSSLTHIYIPDSVTSIGSQAFAGCSALTGIEIPDSITTIESETFRECSNLRSVVIPDSITSLGHSAFHSCSNLTTIVIPASVTTINSGAFYYCDNLWHVLYKGSEDAWNSISTGDWGNEQLLAATRHYNCTGDEITDLENKICTICASLCNHEWIEATCETPKTCALCGSVDGDALGHDFQLTVDPVPTVKTAGALAVECAACGQEHFAELPALNDQDYSYQVIQSATALTDGVVCYTWNNEDYGVVRFYELLSHSVSQQDAQLVIQSATTVADNTIRLEVLLQNNPGLQGIYGWLQYDASALELISVENGTVLESLTVSNYLVWDAEQNTAEDGVLCVLEFRVTENALAGEYFIGLVLEEVLNDRLESVPLHMVYATVKVVNMVYGDASGDGLVSLKDVLLLRQYLANRNPETGESTVRVEAGADADGDGSINLKDVLLMRKYLANRDIVTGESSVILGPQ